MSDKLNRLIKTIKRLTETTYYKIIIDEKTPEIYESKFGGLPYWEPRKKYPTNPEGKELYLLAQINFDKEKVESPLPQKGMLQFFINDNDYFGMNFGEQNKQTDFRVIYHETVDYSMTNNLVSELDVPSLDQRECFPIEGEFKISLKKDRDYINLVDVNFDKIFSIAYQEVYGKKLKDNCEYYDILKEDEQEKLEKAMENSTTKMLGYPEFTQDDPRRDLERYKPYDTLLLQIDSINDVSMWGDCGICNFFISKESLEKKDFTDVLYNWDCS